MARTSLTTLRLVRGSSALIAAGLLLTACSSSGPHASTSVTNSNTGTGSNSLTTPPPSASSTPAALSGNSGSTFCGDARAQKKLTANEVQIFTTGTPAQIETLEKQDLKELPIWASLAPSQLKSAMDLVVATDENVYKILAADGFDFKKLTTAQDEQFSTPAFTKANTTIDDYLTQVCKIPSSIPTS